MISVKPRWQRPAKHHMSHRKVHQYQKKYHRGNQSLKQNRRLMICQCIRIILCAIPLISFSCICALFPCSISCLLPWNSSKDSHYRRLLQAPWILPFPLSPDMLHNSCPLRYIVPFSVTFLVSYQSRGLLTPTSLFATIQSPFPLPFPYLYFISFWIVETSSSTTSSCPSRISLTTQE